MDNRPVPQFDYRRPWLQIGKDILVCSYGSAPWLIPEDGQAMRLDWQRGFTMEDARHIFSLPDGSLVADGFGGHDFRGSVYLSPDPARQLHALQNSSPPMMHG